MNASPAPPEIAVSGLDSGPEAAGASKEEAGDAGDVKISRFANQDLVRDVVIGYTGDEDEDPPQVGSSRERHNRDVQQMISEGLDVPIAKDQRSSYVWVAASKVPENQGVEGNSEIRKKKYTWNSEEMQPVDAARSKQLRCDICGALCTEVLYEFRCYKRMRPDEPRSVGRRLHPFVSYISKECGQGLLGNPSGASKLRERIYRLLMDPDGLSAVEEFEEVWRLGNETMRQILTDELRFLSKTEAGVPRRAAELRKAEAVHGELQKEREDVFRAVARATGPLLNARDLASITIKHAEEQDEESLAQPSEKGKDGGQETSGFLGQVAAALHERKPLPAVPVQWSRADVVSCIQALVNAWRPLRVELHDSLQVKQVFQFEPNSHKQKKRKKEKEKAAPLIRLVYLPGCQELHSISAQSCSREEVQALKERREGPLKECKEEYAPLEAGQGRYSRAEDRAIELPEGKITFEQVAKALNQITWPNCFTRNNVRPDGAPFIEAFPLGIVLNYSLGLVCSRPTQLWPNLTKLLAMWFAQEQPEFPYTTVQLNKDYATKMHVDGNNHGPSFIIGLGDYTGGEVWILDENGTVEVEIPCPLRGWPQLRPGTKVKGRLEDCHNKWVKFDGNTPHMTMPYKGSRISLVFFTRRGWLRMLPQTKESLESSGFLLPGEDFLNLSTVKEVKEEPEVKKEKKVAEAPEVQEVEEEEIAVSDDEMDEDEKADEVMRAEQDAATWPSWDWGARLRAHLNAFAGTDLANSNLNVALLGSANVFGMALQELIGSSSFRILTCTEAGGVAMRLMKRTCKPQHAFLNLDAAMAGHGHCDIHHKVCTSGTEISGSETSIMSEDLLFGSFPCEPFLNQDPARPSCFDDPRSNVFKLLRKHMVVQKPRAALLLVEGWQKLPEASRPSVKSFLLNGKDPRIVEYMESDEQALWGLRYLDGYGAAFLEVPLAACGVPLTGQEAMIILVRDDCGGASAAEATSQLVKSMLSSEPKLLQRCSIHALMFSDEDDRVVQAQQAAKEAYKKGKSRRRSLNATMRRRMMTEVRELGLQPGEAPYTDHLNGIRIAAARMGQQGQKSADKWIKQVPDEKAIHLNLLFARARQHGLDLQNLCVDLSQGFSALGRRDDGLLPRSVEENSVSEFYSFNHHRALIGQELLLCVGYPIWRLDFRSISDAEATQLAVRSAAVPAVGICMAAMLAVVELPGKEKLAEKHIAHLLDKVEFEEEKPDVSSELQPLASSQHFPCGVAWARVMKDSTPSHEHGEAAQNAASDPEAFTAITAPGKSYGGHDHGGHGAHVSEVSAMSVISETVAEIREAGLVLLSSLCLVSVLEGADMALLPAVFYALQTDLGLSLSDLATMTLIQGVTTSAVAPFWGILADRGIMKRKHIIVMGCVLQGLVTMLLSVIDSMVGMTMLRALNGALLASLRPVASGIIADVTSEQRRGKVYGVVQFCTNCGLMAGGLIGTPLSTKTVLGWQGWRVAFIGIGSLSVLVGLFAACTMTEPARETSGIHAKDRGAMRQELRKLLSYFRMPTFCALIFQGWFGGIPWNAMGYATLFYQVGGLDDAKAAVLSSMGQASGAFGGLLGGLIGDRLARCCPLHGRPLTAQISVLAGIPVAYLTFMVDPPEGEVAFFYYMGLVTFLGLTATWCGVGVNLPILTEIVRPEGRSTILAWESALESTFACILGNAMVGFLAENVFGYRLDNSEHARADVESRRALGKALTLTCFTPWLICWVVYSLLHWTYPKDLKRVKNEKLKDKKEAYLQRKREKAEEARKANEALEKTEEPEVEGEAAPKYTIICTNVDGTTMSPMSSPVAI